MLQAIAEGNERAFNDLFQLYHQHLGGFVFSATRSHELTEEIIQDVFVKVWEERAALPAVRNFSAYLFIVTRNQTLNAIRKSARMKQQQQQAMLHFTLADDREQAPADNYYALLDNAVEQLPLQQKKVFRLRQQGLKNSDVALRLNLSVNSVKKYQQLAVQAIARFIRSGLLSETIILICLFF
ncbi:RNA polymerase sigma factor [Chitinophaga japonensis]|nr:sigma-70 family RNA polymerase sigma factor [Chitinophaga japonensis]